MIFDPNSNIFTKGESQLWHTMSQFWQLLVLIYQWIPPLDYIILEKSLINPMLSPTPIVPNPKTWRIKENYNLMKWIRILSFHLEDCTEIKSTNAATSSNCFCQQIFSVSSIKGFHDGDSCDLMMAPVCWQIDRDNFFYQSYSIMNYSRCET